MYTKISGLVQEAMDNIGLVQMAMDSIYSFFMFAQLWTDCVHCALSIVSSVTLCTQKTKIRNVVYYLSYLPQTIFLVETGLWVQTTPSLAECCGFCHVWELESEQFSCYLGWWAVESLGASPLTCEMYRLFVSWGLIEQSVSIPIMVVSYKLILIFCTHTPPHTHTHKCMYR